MKQKEAKSLEWLEWFHKNANFGPSDADIRFNLQRDFEKSTGKKIPSIHRLDSYIESYSNKWDNLSPFKKWLYRKLFAKTLGGNYGR